MKKWIIALGIVFHSLAGMSQYSDSLADVYQNSAERMLEMKGNLKIGGYGQIDYNQPIGSDTRQNGTLDVHRLVVLFGYRFNSRTQFITEIEFEHVKEVYVEQAFLQYKINNYVNFRGGLLLVPMGIVNEYHEPPAFNGVERPLVDKYIAPTTWREIGFGFSGNIIDASLKYQAYLVNGFNGYDDSGHLNGENGLRKGRQKGAESFISSPNLTGKVEYYGIKGLNIGLSGYMGKSQTTMKDGLSKQDQAAQQSSDSSVVGISMAGMDARYRIRGFQFKGQLYYTSISNTEEYNYFASSGAAPNDLGSSMLGYYFEAGYDVFRLAQNIDSELIVFSRLENYNTHQSVASGIIQNDAYNNTVITSGLGWKITSGSVLKADIQFFKSKSDTDFAKVLNVGIGVMF